VVPCLPGATAGPVTGDVVPGRPEVRAGRATVRPWLRGKTARPK